MARASALLLQLVKLVLVEPFLEVEKQECQNTEVGLILISNISN